MDVIAKQLEAQYPATNTGQRIALLPLYNEVVGGTRGALWILFGAVTLLLLISCANVANLLLMRGFRRHKEIAIRAALGAGPRRLIRQLLTESLILSLLGGALGLFLALIGAPLIASMSPRNIIRLDEIKLDVYVLAFTFGVSLLTGLIFGLMPAVQITKINMNESLKEGRRGVSDTRQRVRSLLVSFEVALALVLLIGAGLIIKSIEGLLSVDPGFKTDNVVTMRVLLPQSKYPDSQQWLKFFQDVTLPGVQSVGLINNLPLSGTGMSSWFVVEGRPAPGPQDGYLTGYRVVSSTYFNTMGLAIKRGTPFTEHNNQNSPKVAIISEAMANRFWPSEDPIGQRIAIGRDQAPGRDTVWREIVGIAASVKHWGLTQDAPSETYVPDLQSPSLSMFLVVRAASDPTNLVPSIRAQILALDKDQPIYSVRTIDDLLLASISQSRFYMMLLSIFAGIALIMAVVGIYGLIAYSVNQQKHEIGLRLALGARPVDIIRTILGRGMKLALIGVAAGVAAAIALTRLMTGLLHGVSTTDPLTFVGVSLILYLVALMATYFPARSATSVDPAVALRVE
jgi:putative ABC transport system permease protein